MDSNTAKLAWLKNLYPGYFSLTMATGIIAIALDMLEKPLLSDALYCDHADFLVHAIGAVYLAPHAFPESRMG